MAQQLEQFQVVKPTPHYIYIHQVQDQLVIGQHDYIYFESK